MTARKCNTNSLIKSGKNFWFINISSNFGCFIGLRNLAHMSRMHRFTSGDFYKKYVLEYFGKSFATSMIAQPQKIGYVRSDEDREKVALYGKRRLDNAIDLGLYPLINLTKNRNEVVQKATSILRDRYLTKKPAAPAAAPASD